MGLTAVKDSLGRVRPAQATAFLRKGPALGGKPPPPKLAAISISREQAVEPEVAREFQTP